MQTQQPYNLYKTNRIRTAVDLLLNDYSFFSTITQYQNHDNFYYYDNVQHLYILDAEMFIVNKLNELFSPDTFRHYSHIKAVIDQIQRLSPIIPDDQLNPFHLINYRNGILNKSTNKLLPHSHRFYVTTQIPQNYVNSSSNRLTQLAKRMALLN
jgi:phage/plasmid-associated DNA primase